MKTLAIKAGKALSTLKREGLIKGGKRVGSAFFAMFGKVGSGDVLYITGGVGDSARYRTWRQAEELEIHGFHCSVTVQDNPFLPRYAGKFQIFIFHRVLFTPAVKKMIDRIKAQKKEIIFETDDLVHDPKYLEHMDYFKKMNRFEKMLYENGVGGEILKDEYVKTCVTTTMYLAEKLKAYGKRVFVSKNKLSNYDVRIMNDIFEKKKKPDGKKVKIGYFSGTASHDKDFETVKRVLVGILEKYPDVELNLFGPLEIDHIYAKFGERVKKHPFSPWEKHLENIARVDVNIAPLEIGNPFCESKSELKLIEAGIVGVPTVATSTQTFQEAIEDGVDGFVAGDDEEWKEKLEKLISDKDLRASMGQKAREKVLREYTNRNSDNEEYYGYLRDVIARIRQLAETKQSRTIQ
ncbi:MAG: glycosyltransferase [Parcubacteria group bacterium]|jgi:glycosyltransferase involved in cell wall biosynthesis